VLQNILKLETPFVLAPMAGITDSPFRRLAKRFACSAVTTEMVSSEALIRDHPQSWKLLQWHPEERPITVQLFGHNPESLAKATALVSDLQPDLIELNLGCSVRKILRSGAGSALLKDLVKLKDILQAMRQSTELPLSIKLRLGWENSKIPGITTEEDPIFPQALQVIELASDCKISLAVVHGRSVQSGFSGPVDWQAIAQIKRHSPIPIIGNGDIKTAAEAKERLQESGADAVMIGRAAINQPWIFSDIYHLFLGSGENILSVEERQKELEEFLDHTVTRYGEYRAVLKNRRILCGIIRGTPQCVNLRYKLNHLTTISEVKTLLSQYFQQLQQQFELTSVSYS